MITRLNAQKGNEMGVVENAAVQGARTEEQVSGSYRKDLL